MTGRPAWLAHNELASAEIALANALTAYAQAYRAASSTDAKLASVSRLRSVTAHDVTLRGTFTESPAGAIPSYVGSPSMRVVSAIPLGAGNEFMCTVVHRESPLRFGTVHAYRQAGGHWSADAGHYDYSILGDALRGMISRAFKGE